MEHSPPTINRVTRSSVSTDDSSVPETRGVSSNQTFDTSSTASSQQDRRAHHQRSLFAGNQRSSALAASNASRGAPPPPPPRPSSSPVINRVNDDAFSSSSSSGSSTSDDHFDDDDDDDSPRQRNVKGFTSEFDKALHRGKGPSRGNFVPTVAPPATSTANSTDSYNPLSATFGAASTPPPPPPQRGPKAASNRHSQSNSSTSGGAANTATSNAPAEATTTSLMLQQPHPSHFTEDPLNGGVLPDVLMTMRQKIESLTLFDSDMMKLAQDPNASVDDADDRETRESLKRSSQQSMSAAVLVSLAHKRYERRRLAAMEIEKMVRDLVDEEELDRVRAILLLLSDDYVRSTSEDARKGGVVALAASAIGLKRAPEASAIAQECRDLILASVVHACQDHSQRVRYYATESLFNVVKVIPALAVQHFFILFEILRSLYADVDVDVKSGAELLDKKLKEVIVGAMNSGQFTADACVPVFARFVHMRNKATKRLTLTWLQELAEKLIGAPILEFLHLFLGGIFDMVADPTLAIRQSALAFLQSVLPKLLTIDDHVQEEAIDDMGEGIQVDFDKILQSLVTTMEHPDPFVRKVAMYWMSRIVRAHIDGNEAGPVTGRDNHETNSNDDDDSKEDTKEKEPPQLSAATLSVRNSLPHVLPGILLSIGDTFKSNNTVKDSFLPDQTTHALAIQTNACLQDAVRREGRAYVQHLDSFIVALREELDSPGGVNARNPPALERKPYRMDVKHDGTGIESQGWFRASKDVKQEDVESMMKSRLCALHWVSVLYESVVPDVLKADYAREFVIPIIHQLVDNPPEKIIFKSLEVLAKITVPVSGEAPTLRNWDTLKSPVGSDGVEEVGFPMTQPSVAVALDLLSKDRRLLKSRDREVFSVLIQLHAYNLHMIGDVSKMIAYMCRLQPPEFVFVSFAVELERFVVRRQLEVAEARPTEHAEDGKSSDKSHSPALSRDLQFVSSFIQQMCHVLLNAKEAHQLRAALKDCIGSSRHDSEHDRRRGRLFHILLQSFSHNLVATTALCLWGGAFRTASLFLRCINPPDIHLMFLLEVDKLVELLERPLFRHLHVRMLENDGDPLAEGSGTMLFQTLKSLLIIIPQSTCYNVLRDRLVSTSRFRQSSIFVRVNAEDEGGRLSKETETFVNRVLDIRELHCAAYWSTVRAESLETFEATEAKTNGENENGSDRREWLGYGSKEEERVAQARYREDKRRRQASGVVVEELGMSNYNDLGIMASADGVDAKTLEPNPEQEDSWKDYWAQTESGPSTF